MKATYQTSAVYVNSCMSNKRSGCICGIMQSASILEFVNCAPEQVSQWLNALRVLSQNATPAASLPLSAPHVPTTEQQ